MTSEGISFEEAAAPEGLRLYAIGDIHGRFDLMAEMHARIMDEIRRDRSEDWRIIYLGDYIDRGGQEAQVLDFLAQITSEEPRVQALAGNHDQGLLEFLSGNSLDNLFVNNGGETTAASYGVALSADAPREEMQRTRQALLEAMPQSHIAFMRALPLSFTYGDYFFCHAGVRPGVPLEAQDRHDLLWIRQEFLRHQGLFGKVIIHGHTPVRRADVCPNRVNLDTGAWRSGLLTAMMLEGKRKRLLEVALS
ncbi:metallophosphoesterase [Nitratireductor basaltis]|uniref:Metallophosphoesterase n=1 Tax=Nitratireductor basaltis TaxID=472175 RepID=A0A084UDF0_9HYPH|nr:metallophosphoesterase [Nitratireductor basaltis]KFB10986.1 Metallophosphoesterase [Nitratireductor basaltis]